MAGRGHPIVPVPDSPAVGCFPQRRRKRAGGVGGRADMAGWGHPIVPSLTLGRACAVARG